MLNRGCMHDHKALCSRWQARGESALPPPDDEGPLDSFKGRLLDGVWSLAMGDFGRRPAPAASDRRCAPQLVWLHPRDVAFQGFRVQRIKPLNAPMPEAPFMG